MLESLTIPLNWIVCVQSTPSTEYLQKCPEFKSIFLDIEKISATPKYYIEFELVRNVYKIKYSTTNFWVIWCSLILKIL